VFVNAAESEPTPAGRITIAGVGGAGCHIIARMVAAMPEGPKCVAIDTDTRCLDISGAPSRLQIGKRVAKGMGAGGDVSLGRLAASNDAELVEAMLADTDLLLIVAGLGGGVGTGAVPMILETARDADVMTFCFLTLPFAFEETPREETARGGLARIQSQADAVIALPNDALSAWLGENVRIDKAFERAEEVTCEAVTAVWTLLANPGVINLDFADLRRIVQNTGGVCAYGIGHGRGKQRAEAAVNAALNFPLLKNGRSLEESPSVLVNISGGGATTLTEIRTVMDKVKEAARADARIVMGTALKERADTRLSVMILTGVQRPTTIVHQELDVELDGERPPDPDKEAEATQVDLPLVEPGRGRFQDVEPTIFRGEDLDIPSYVRRKITIEK